MKEDLTCVKISKVSIMSDEHQESQETEKVEETEEELNVMRISELSPFDRKLEVTFVVVEKGETRSITKWG